MVNLAKKSAALKALEFVKNNMVIGIGTGSTVAYFIEGLGKRIQVENLSIKAIATSKNSELSAKKYGIPLIDAGLVTSVDLTVDGADEIDPQNRMIKGGGGALLREKIAAKMAKKMIVIVDGGKVVANLGKHPLPLEILPWGKEATRLEIEKLGYKGTWREGVTTDNGNVIFDIQLLKPTDNPEKIEQALTALPGILTTGFFFNLAPTVVIGYGENEVKIR